MGTFQTHENKKYYYVWTLNMSGGEWGGVTSTNAHMMWHLIFLRTDSTSTRNNFSENKHHAINYTTLACILGFFYYCIPHSHLILLSYTFINFYFTKFNPFSTNLLERHLLFFHYKLWYSANLENGWWWQTLNSRISLLKGVGKYRLQIMFSIFCWKW